MSRTAERRSGIADTQRERQAGNPFADRMTEIDDLATLLRDDTPLIDTRSPVEFAKGSLPAAINLPLMTDVEREAVGTCYKEQGADAAVRLGHELVAGDLREQRVGA